MLCGTTAGLEAMTATARDFEGKASVPLIEFDGHSLLHRSGPAFLNAAAGGPHRPPRAMLRWLCIMRC